MKLDRIISEVCEEPEKDASGLTKSLLSTISSFNLQVISAKASELLDIHLGILSSSKVYPRFG